MNLWIKLLFICSLGLQSYAVQAQICQDIFSDKNVSIRYTFAKENPSTAPLVLFLEKLDRTRIKNTNLSVEISEWGSSFNKAYRESLLKAKSGKDILDVYRVLAKVLEHKYSEHIISGSLQAEKVGKAFDQILKINHAHFFKKNKDKMTLEERYELFEILLKIRLGKESAVKVDHGRRFVWRIVWVSRLILLPDIAIHDIFNILEGNFEKIKDPWMRGDSLSHIKEHTPDIVEAFISLPVKLRSRYRRLFIEKFYITSKNSRAIVFLQKLNHHLLRRLVKKINGRAKVDTEEIIRLVDEYWEANGYGKDFVVPGTAPRGNYSFGKVIDVARNIQAEMRKKHTWFKPVPSLLMFGSFPNGMASMSNSQGKGIEFHSDLDVTFSNAFRMHDKGFRGENWIWDGKGSPFIHDLVLKMESSMEETLNIENYRPGRLFSLVTQISKKKLLYTTEGSYQEYMSRPSPIIVEVGVNNVKVYIHLLKEGASQVETISFEVR